MKFSKIIKEAKKVARESDREVAEKKQSSENFKEIVFLKE